MTVAKLILELQMAVEKNRHVAGMPACFSDDIFGAPSEIDGNIIVKQTMYKASCEKQHHDEILCIDKTGLMSEN